MRSDASTVDEYLASLPEGRRVAIQAVRQVILANLDAGYEEGMSYGMIGYSVPHRIFPAGYHCDPKLGLPFAALASQKNHMALYLMGLYCGCAEGVTTLLAQWFTAAWMKSGKKLDKGRACLRFKKLEDLSLEIIGEAIRRQPASVYIEQYVSALRSSGRKAGKRA